MIGETSQQGHVSISDTLLREDASRNNLLRIWLVVPLALLILVL